MCRGVRHTGSSKDGEATSTQAHFALELATFRRFKLYRKSIPRGASAWLDAKAADKLGITGLACLQKVSEKETALGRLQFTTDNASLFSAVGSSCQVAGGTAWLWARPEAMNAVDASCPWNLSTVPIRAYVISSEVLRQALLRIGEHVAEHGITGQGEYQAARDLLLRATPSLGGEPMRYHGETALDAALRLVPQFTSGVLPIQGPPGSGKT